MACALDCTCGRHPPLICKASREAVASLAGRFADLLHDAMTPEQWGEMRRRNAFEAHPGVCHSHDFLDANTIMFAAGGGETGLFASPEDFSEEQAALWDSAWELAMQGWLTAEPIEWANGFTGDVVWRVGACFVIRQWEGLGDGVADNGRYVACKGCAEMFSFALGDEVENPFRATLEEALCDFRGGVPVIVDVA